MVIKGINICALFFFVFCGNLFSQQLSHQVLVPVAGVSTAGGINYSQTTGETIIEIIGNSDFVLTQGFQQPGMKAASEISPNGNGVDVYPNPATDFIKIKFFGDTARNFKVDIINMSGSTISSATISFAGSYYYIQPVDFSKFMVGLYFVRIASTDGLIDRTFKIEKNNR